jgi:hypothetical protein
MVAEVGAKVVAGRAAEAAAVQRAGTKAGVETAGCSEAAALAVAKVAAAREAAREATKAVASRVAAVAEVKVVVMKVAMMEAVQLAAPAAVVVKVVGVMAARMAEWLESCSVHRDERQLHSLSSPCLLGNLSSLSQVLRRRTRRPIRTQDGQDMYPSTCTLVLLEGVQEEEGYGIDLHQCHNLGSRCRAGSRYVTTQGHHRHTRRPKQIPDGLGMCYRSSHRRSSMQRTTRAPQKYSQIGIQRSARASSLASGASVKTSLQR